MEWKPSIKPKRTIDYSTDWLQWRWRDKTSFDKNLEEEGRQKVRGTRVLI